MSPPPPSGRRPRRRRTIDSPARPNASGPAKPAKPAGAKPTGAKPAGAKPARPAAAKPAKPAQPARPAAKAAKPAGSSFARTPAKPRAPAKPPAAKAPAKPAAPDTSAGGGKQVPEVGALAGRTIGRCKLSERIGIGRTAVVYRALYEPLDQEVAVKILLPETAAIPELVERFHSEAKAIAKIDNENVLKIYDVGTEGENHYMVVELLEGEEIYELIHREEQVEVTDALRILRQAANGMAAAHAKDIIHRDIKPQNLFLLEDGTVKVVDFGLAASFDESAQRVGTPHFMAPEVCETGVADLGSDVYALGITLYHLLIGHPPYAGESVQGILQAHIRAEPLRPERERRDIPKEVAEVVRDLTKRDSLARPSAAEVVEMLDGIGGQALKEKDSLRGRRRRRPRSRSRAAVVRRERKEARKSPLPVVIGAVMLVAIIGGVAALTGGQKKPAQPAETAADPGSGDGVASKPPGALQDADAEALAALEAERKAAAEKAAEEKKREEAGREALGRAKAHARQWQDRDDTAGVIERYRMVARSHKGTTAAAAAKTLVRKIKSGEVHPHPDRTWSSSQDLASARKDWEQIRPKVEELISKHAYRGARKRIPVAMNDPSGKFGREIRFWESYTRQLQDFQSGLVKAVKERLKKEEPLEITHDGTALPIERFDDIKITVRKDSKRVELSWSDLEPIAIATLAERAMRHLGTEGTIQQMAFAYAHRLEDKFWERDLDMSSISNPGEHAAMHKAYSSRYENR